MHDYINAEDTKLWDFILDGPYFCLKELKDGDLITTLVKIIMEYKATDTKNDRKELQRDKDSSVWHWW